ncbi:MAG: hypothetical protein COB36_12395 [Alphaproteobacteria bacterium]|nr:MAG: hypothetical protein COB36_12395 [Alphaproteobacteria bacterium]
MPKLALISITLSALVFVGLLPLLEISDRHLLSPDWIAHARFHNAWQLLTNALLSILAVFLVWKGAAPRVGMGIALMINVSLLGALIMGSLYGGSTIVVSDGSDLAIGNINIAAIVIGFLTVLLLLGYRAVSNLPKD